MLVKVIFLALMNSVYEKSVSTL